ncbi:hypothetical protein ACHAPA_010302 [Fusarium lateritium]
MDWRRDATMKGIKTQHCSSHYLLPKYAHKSLNKDIAVYFESSLDDGGWFSRKIGCYIYREWLHLHEGRPPFQRHGFLATAAQITEDGPQSLDQLLTFHGDFCQQLSLCSNDLVSFYGGRGPDPSEMAFFEPVPSTKIQSWRDHGYTMRHLFRAIYMVVDDQAQGEPPEPSPPKQEHDDHVFYHEAVTERNLARCTVLLVKTGDEAHLHQPISFLPLFDAGLALPVNREDHESHLEETVVRVKLNVALHFVFELLRKEEAALDDIGQLAQDLREEQDAFCQAWVDRVMCHSNEVGIDSNGFTWQAIRRTLARLNNEAFDLEQVYPFQERIRRWIC